jgi:hypothetical protein
MRRTNGRVGVLLPLLLAVLLAGCTGSGDDDGIATAGGDATETEEPGSEEELTEEEIYEQQLAFAACLREHGVDVEDPALGEPFTIQGRGEELEPAMEACQHLRPQGGPGQGPDDPEVRERMLEFAQCMRDNGVESFPDPQSGGGLQIGPEQADDPQFEAAQETCNEDVLGGDPPTLRDGGSDT